MSVLDCYSLQAMRCLVWGKGVCWAHISLLWHHDIANDTVNRTPGTRAEAKQESEKTFSQTIQLFITQLCVELP